MVRQLGEPESRRDATTEVMGELQASASKQAARETPATDLSKHYILHPSGEERLLALQAYSFLVGLSIK